MIELPRFDFHFRDVLTWKTGEQTLEEALIDATLDHMRSDLGEQAFSKLDKLYEDNTVQPVIFLHDMLVIVQFVRKVEVTR